MYLYIYICIIKLYLPCIYHKHVYFTTYIYTYHKHALTIPFQDLALESEAAMATWLRLARALDQQEADLARIATAISKYYVAGT